MFEKYVPAVVSCLECLLEKDWTSNYNFSKEKFLHLVGEGINVLLLSIDHNVEKSSCSLSFSDSSNELTNNRNQNTLSNKICHSTFNLVEKLEKTQNYCIIDI